MAELADPSHESYRWLIGWQNEQAAAAEKQRQLSVLVEQTKYWPTNECLELGVRWD